MNKDIWIVAEYDGKHYLRPVNNANCESAWYDHYEAEAKKVMFEIPQTYTKGSVHNVHEVRAKLDGDTTLLNPKPVI